MAHEAWAEAAARAGIDLSGFDPESSLVARLAWAAAKGLEVGAALSRYSSKLQHSTAAQVEACVRFAAAHRIYIPPEYVCVDEAVTGRKARREALDRVRLILGRKQARVLLVFKVSRLFRLAYLGFKFFQEDVVEEGLRAVSVSQGIDTANEKTWKPLAYMYGFVDETMITATADHVRAGLQSLFRRGYVTGALPVGYERREVPGAPPTKLGKPRTVPAVTPAVAEMIRKHVRWILDGMPLSQAWRRWVAEGGPCDPRSKKKTMSYNAYRRMLSNPRYVGRWAFGRKRNVWSTKRDYNLQVEQPEAEVILVRCEELRILEDAEFAALQAKLLKLKTGRRGPRKKVDRHLWDLVVDCFVCARCDERFYVHGAYGLSMTCKNRQLCPARGMVRREEAVVAVCRKLSELHRENPGLVDQVVNRMGELDAGGGEACEAAIARSRSRVEALSRKVEDLSEQAGEGSDEDRARWKAKVRAARADKAVAEAELAALLRAREGRAALDPERARAVVVELGELLEAGASGRLGGDVVHRAAEAFRLLTGGRVVVHVEPRAGRKETNVRGRFRADLVGAARSLLGQPGSLAPDPGPEVEVWLREPPKKDALAERVHRLVDVEGKSFTEAMNVLVREGVVAGWSLVWQAYQRYYEMTGQPPPRRPYDKSRRRQAV
jgi:hypothetical protein